HQRQRRRAVLGDAARDPDRRPRSDRRGAQALYRPVRSRVPRARSERPARFAADVAGDRRRLEPVTPLRGVGHYRAASMTATLIDGKAIAQQVLTEVRVEVAGWRSNGNRAPGLATILVGDDPASAVYVANKQKACAEVGMEGFSYDLPADTSQEEVERLIAEL